MAGAIHFSGAPVLIEGQKSALHVIAYLLFVNFSNLENADAAPVTATLTPREREVMIQTLPGFTAAEIAGQIGMAERAVNQHIENVAYENVAYKFHTKNRLHTVASLLRLNLLD